MTSRPNPAHDGSSLSALRAGPARCEGVARCYSDLVLAGLSPGAAVKAVQWVAYLLLGNDPESMCQVNLY